MVGLIALWPTATPVLDLSQIGFADEVVRAETVTTTIGPCSYDASLDCRLFQLTLIEEPVGDIALLEFPDEPGQPDLMEGDIVYLAVVEFDDGTVDYQYAGLDRRVLLVVLALVFAVAVIGLGRLRGVAALIGLVVSIGILMWFILPAIISGEDAVLVALVGGGAIAIVSLYLAHGYNPLTHVAALGAFSALALTTALSWLTVEAASFSGLVTEGRHVLTGFIPWREAPDSLRVPAEIFAGPLLTPDLDLNGLLLAGIVLGAIGALDDVTVTQASAVWEVHGANQQMGRDELFESGLRVGRDHIVSTVNTLLLAYAGASLPLLLFFTLSNQSLGFIASSEVVAIEIVRTLVGSIGLVAAVPVTTWLSARVVSTLPEETSTRASS